MTKENLKIIFDHLYHNWDNETSHLSSVHGINSNANMVCIMALGEQVVPLILRSLKNKPDHWFYALRELTGVDVIKQEHRGKLHLMAQDWLNWADAQGIEY
jgi:hypothetical protein